MLIRGGMFVAPRLFGAKMYLPSERRDTSWEEDTQENCRAHKWDRRGKGELKGSRKGSRGERRVSREQWVLKRHGLGDPPHELRTESTNRLAHPPSAQSNTVYCKFCIGLGHFLNKPAKDE